MKNQYITLSLTAAVITLLSGCGGTSKESSTDITPTTQSAEARESFQAGLLSLDQNDNQKARTYFIKATEQDPKLAIAYMFKAYSANTPKEFAEDMTLAKSNLSGAGELEKLYVELTATYLTSDYPGRIRIGQDITAKYPLYPRPQVDLGFAYLNGNEVEKGRACIQKAVELDPKWIGGYSAMVNAYLFFDPKDFKKAEENALKAVELAPSSAGTQIALGDCYRAENDLEKAKAAYSKAIELDPGAADPYYKKGNANTFLGNMDEARQNFTDGGKYDLTPTGAVPFIAYTYLYAGDPKAAVKCYTDALSGLGASGKSPAVVNAARFSYLQDCASIAGFHEDAATLKDLIAQMEPLSVQLGNDAGTEEAKLSQKATMQALEAMLAILEGKFDVAKTRAEEIKTTLAPVNDPFKLDNYELVLGYLGIKQKNYTEAVAHLEKTRPTSVLNKYWLAVAYEGAGNKDKAMSMFRELADYNFNGMDFALIRADVKKRLSAEKS
jgi:Tfp pilus assembly protein PilF